MKPRVMSLVIFTCVVGLIIAPVQVDFITATLSLAAVALGAGAAGSLNMWYESDLDALMKRKCTYIWYHYLYSFCFGTLFFF